MKKYILSIIFIMLFVSGNKPIEANTTVPARYLDTSNKVKVDCASIYDEQKSLVIMTYGQSMAANAVPTRYTPRNNVYNFFNGGCYIASDPLLGTSAEWGSIWSRLGDKILDTWTSQCLLDT